MPDGRSSKKKWITPFLQVFLTRLFFSDGLGGEMWIRDRAATRLVCQREYPRKRPIAKYCFGLISFSSTSCASCPSWCFSADRHAADNKGISHFIKDLPPSIVFLGRPERFDLFPTTKDTKSTKKSENETLNPIFKQGVVEIDK